MNPTLYCLLQEDNDGTYELYFYGRLIVIVEPNGNEDERIFTNRMQYNLFPMEVYEKNNRHSWLNYPISTRNWE